MITKSDNLIIFEDFRVNNNLPKHKSSIQSGSLSINDFGFSDNTGVFFDTQSSSPVLSWREETSIQFKRVKSSWWQKIISCFRKQVIETMSPQQFFTSVKNSAKEIEIIQERLIGYEKAILDAKRANQTALLEKLTFNLTAVRSEAQLVAIGLNKYVEEKDIVKFYKGSKKGLRLDWIDNFTRTIPSEILDLKDKADELEIFDNYVILHYDPTAKSYALTQAQIDALKDPILFGVIKGRRLLYFVGDWVDEVCDLTFDQLAEHIGKESIKKL